MALNEVTSLAAGLGVASAEILLPSSPEPKWYETKMVTIRLWDLKLANQKVSSKQWNVDGVMLLS